MKRKIIPVIMLMAALVSSIPASADTVESKEETKKSDEKFSLKVFGEYEDTNPQEIYIDENGRVMMDKDLFVAVVYLQMKNPGVTQAQMQRDFRYYIKNGYTYVCLDEISTKLGIYVDYNKEHNLVSITEDKYQRGERFSNYALTLPERAVSYEKASKYMDKDRLTFLYGSECLNTKTYSDAVINLDSEKIMQGLYTFPALNLSDHYDNSEGKSLYRDALKEAEKELNMDTQNMHVRFVADENGMYKNKGMSRLTVSLRGTIVLWIDCPVSDLSVAEIEYACRCGFTSLKQNEIFCNDCDVHMNLQVNHPVTLNSIVSLGTVENTGMYKSFVDNEIVNWRAADE